MLVTDTHSLAYEIGYWSAGIVLIVAALVLALWGARSLRRTGKGVLRTVTGSVLAGVLALSYTAVAVDEIFVTEGPAQAVPRPSPTPTPTETPTPVPRPTPTPKPPSKKFKPTPVPDPGPAQRYSSCNRAIAAYNAARFEVIKRAKIAWVDGALSALLANRRIVVVNGRCFTAELVEMARSVTLATVNEVPPQISTVDPACQQATTDAYRLLGLAVGMAKATDGDVDVRAGIDALGRRNPECLSESDVREMKKLLEEELPAAS